MTTRRYIYDIPALDPINWLFFAGQKNVSALQTWNKDDDKKIKKMLHASEITIAIETIGGFYQWFPYAGWLPNTNGCQKTNCKKTILKCDDREGRHKFFFFFF